MNKRGNNRNATKKLTICAMLAALGVVILYLGSLIEILDISMAVFASLVCVFAVIEYGGSTPWMIYGVISILGLLLLPDKTPAVFFTVFFGFYPILKEKFEKRPKVIAWLLKEIVFNVSLAVIVTLSIFTLNVQGDTLLQIPIMLAVLLILCEMVFILYDIALTRLITFYLLKLRNRFKFK